MIKLNKGIKYFSTKSVLSIGENMNIQVQKFVKDYSNKKVFYDPSFQRRVVWDNTNISKYVRSLTLGRSAYTNIVLVDVDKCLELANDNVDDVSSKYFLNLKEKGYKFLSLDGQNRSKTIINFMNNEITITARIRDVKGNIEKVENKYFKDLTQLQQYAIELSNVSVVIADEVSVEDVSDVFRTLNDGMPLNAQEMRNSFRTPIARFIRNISLKYGSALKRIVRENDFKRMGDDELIAKMLMILMENKPGKCKYWDLGSADVDSFYRLGLSYYTLKDDNSPYNHEDLKRASSIFQLWSNILLKQTYYAQSRTISAKMNWATLYAAAWVHDNDYIINDYVKFFNHLKKIDDDLITNAETAYTKRRTEYINSGIDPDEVSVHGYYHKWINLPHQYKYRNFRINKLIKKLNSSTEKLSLRKKGTNDDLGPLYVNEQPEQERLSA